MGKMKKRGTAGQCTAYVTQKQAMRRLQITLPNFRRICILKGIYPTEPNNRKKVGKGNSERRVYYYSKDIAFLAKEPLIETFRKLRSHQLKLKKAKAKDDKDKFFRARFNKPRYSLHALVKERYPNRCDAIRDLSNSLNLLFMFARLPRLIQFNFALIHLSRRLCVEFLNYLITMRCIRKAFITIKGYFIEAEILGISVTWVMPHISTSHAPTDIDFRLMATCLEFDATLVGSILTHLYKQSGLTYPPKSAQRIDVDTSNNFCTAMQVHFEFLSSLAVPLKRQTADFEVCDDEEMKELQAIDTQVTACVQREVQKQKQVKLFEGKKFFLNRETPREIITLIIHACGGHCSYDASLCTGATFSELDKVDYQIVDRPMIDQMSADRYYVQPQWVFDSLNAGRLLPAQDYLPGVSLPPHLSPFLGTDPMGLATASVNLLQRGGLTGVAPGLGSGAKDYRPPEADYLAGLVTLSQIRGKQICGDQENMDEDKHGAARPKNKKRNKEELITAGDDEENGTDDNSDDDGATGESAEDDEKENHRSSKKRRNAIIHDDTSLLAKRMKNDDTTQKGKHSVIVRPGKGEKPIAKDIKKQEEAKNERQMREMLMSKKHRKVYTKMTHAVKRRDKEIRDLTARRSAHDSGQA